MITLGTRKTCTTKNTTNRMKMKELLMTLVSFWKTYIVDEAMLGLILEDTSRKIVKAGVAAYVAGQITGTQFWKLKQSTTYWMQSKKLKTTINF